MNLTLTLLACFYANSKFGAFPTVFFSANSSLTMFESIVRRFWIPPILLEQNLVVRTSGEKSTRFFKHLCKMQNSLLQKQQVFYA